MASLYHDDVIDQSVKRREVPTVNHKWGNKIAVWGGDFLMSRSLQSFAASGDRINQMATQAVSTLWEGQMREIESSYNLDNDESSYLSIIEKKTATLCEFPCRIGAALGNVAIESSSSLCLYGKNLGIAFQLVDDILDIIDSNNELNKLPGADLKEGIYTLPVIWLLKSGSTDARRLHSLLGRSEMEDHHITECMSLIPGKWCNRICFRCGEQFFWQKPKYN